MGSSRLGVTCAQANCGAACECYWLNGDPDNANAVVSETSVLVPDSMSADDLYIPAGKVLLAQEFCGVMVTNDLRRVDGWTIDVPDARLTIYEDCNGKPGETIATFFQPVSDVIGDAPFGFQGQWKYVRFCFDLSGLRLEACEAEQRIWVSLVGVGDDDPGERYFWATSATAGDSPIQGTQAQLLSQWIEGFTTEWRDIEDTNADCHDLSFRFCGELIQVIAGNGEFAQGCGVKMLNTGTFGTKLADNFSIAPCSLAELRQITLWIATNLSPTRARLDLYENTCQTPGTLIPQTGSLTASIVLDDMNMPLMFQGTTHSLNVYRLTWRFDPGALGLEGGQNYWAAVSVSGSSGPADEAFVLCASSGLCDITLTEARFLAPPYAISTWTPLSSILSDPRDLALEVLGIVSRDPALVAAPPLIYAAPERPITNQPDLNADGRVDSSDVAEVLRSLIDQQQQRQTDR